MAAIGISLGMVLLAAAVALLWFGWRGRRVDDHPVCRRCGFDLFGVYPLRKQCPECGASLGPKVVRAGNRRCRPASLIAGLVLLLLLASAGGLAGWSAANGYDWTKYKLVLLPRNSPTGEMLDELIWLQQEAYERNAISHFDRMYIEDAPPFLHFEAQFPSVSALDGFIDRIRRSRRPQAFAVLFRSQLRELPNWRGLELKPQYPGYKYFHNGVEARLWVDSEGLKVWAELSPAKVEKWDAAYTQAELEGFDAPRVW